MSLTPGYIARSCATLFASLLAISATAMAEPKSDPGAAPPRAAASKAEAAAPSPPDPEPTAGADAALDGTAGGEVIVVVPRKRAQGSSDLLGSETQHAGASLGLEQPEFATIVRVEDSEGERRTVSEVLARSVGVSARSLGGLGAFSSISVRGADASHTTVSVDGVPISRIASTTANLGQFELGSFESVELYRGGVPLELGGSGVGGAVNMRTALGRGSDGKALFLSAGLGSYGARHMRARFLGGERESNQAYHLSAAYNRASGDFDYFNDGGTALNRDDDQTSTRRNNGYDRIEVVGRIRQGAWTLGSRSSVNEQGLPGSGHDPALSAGLHTAHQLVDARYDHHDFFRQSDHFHLRGFSSVERQRFSDPQSEIGLLAQDSIYRTTSGGAGAGLVMPMGKHQQLQVDLDSRIDWYRETPKGDMMRLGARGNRQALALSLADQLRFLDGALVVDLGGRAEALRTRPGADVFAPTAAQSESVRRNIYLSPRGAFRYRLGTDISVKGSGGRYLRIPTLVEMFGDRGVVLGNSELQAEVGLSSDLGLVWAPAEAVGAVDRIYVEAAAFASRPDKPIVFVNRNGLASQAINLEGARIFGSELVASLRVLQHVTLTGNYSFLDARNRSGGSTYDKQLPARPRHRVYGRVDTSFAPGGRLLVLWADALRLSGNYVDELNIFQLPARSLLGVGVKTAIYEDLLLGIEMKNAANLRSETVQLDPPPSDEFQNTPKALSDVHGYPLPGRSLYLTLQWSH